MHTYTSHHDIAHMTAKAERLDTDDHRTITVVTVSAQVIGVGRYQDHAQITYFLDPHADLRGMAVAFRKLARELDRIAAERTKAAVAAEQRAVDALDLTTCQRCGGPHGDDAVPIPGGGYT